MPVLPNAHLIDSHLDTGQKHSAIERLAIQYGGACTKKFSQGSDSRRLGLGYWYHGRLTGGDRWGGVCKALSVYWIIFHANGQDFWSWLHQGGTSAKVAQAGQIIALHGSYKKSKLSKDEWTRRVLIQGGIVEKKEIVSGSRTNIRGTANQTASSGSHYLAGFMMASQIAPNFSGQTEGYRQWSFHGPPGGGHAVAGWVAQDVMFFDPNYGEFWFETVAKFRQWYGHFWEMSGYGAKYPGGYSINHYAKSVF